MGGRRIVDMVLVIGRVIHHHCVGGGGGVVGGKWMIVFRGFTTTIHRGGGSSSRSCRSIVLRIRHVDRRIYLAVDGTRARGDLSLSLQTLRLR